MAADAGAKARGHTTTKDRQRDTARRSNQPFTFKPMPLHFTLDAWLSKHYPQVNFVRYADDAVVPCTSKAEAEKVLEPIKQRLAEVKLQIKEGKTRIAYGKDYRRKARHEVVKFEFLGFGYQPRARKSSRDGKYFTALENGLPLKRIRNNTSRMTGDCHVRYVRF